MTGLPGLVSSVSIVFNGLTGLNGNKRESWESVLHTLKIKDSELYVNLPLYWALENGFKTGFAFFIPNLAV